MSPATIIGEQLLLSPTRIRAWQGCPAELYLRLDKEVDPDPAGPFADIGSAFHRLAERYLKGNPARKYDGWESSNKKAWEIYLRWIEWLNEDPEVKAQAEVTVVERGLRVNLDERTVVQCIPDNLRKFGPKAIAWDWKSGFKPISPKEYPSTPQPMVTAYLSFCTWPSLESIEIRTVWPATFGRDVVRTFTYTKEMVGPLHKWITATAARIWAEEKFEARPGPNCQTCYAPTACPRTRNSRNLIVSEEDATFSSREAMALKSALDKEKERVKRWCAANGPLEIAGKFVGYKPDKNGTPRFYGL